MPNREVCLSAFSILDPGSQWQRSLSVSEAARPRLNRWAVELKTQLQESNLSAQLLRVSAARTVVQLYG